jgi:hypothetical protein
MRLFYDPITSELILKPHILNKNASYIDEIELYNYTVQSNKLLYVDNYLEIIQGGQLVIDGFMEIV